MDFEKEGYSVWSLLDPADGFPDLRSFAENEANSWIKMKTALECSIEELKYSGWESRKVIITPCE